MFEFYIIFYIIYNIPNIFFINNFILPPPSANSLAFLKLFKMGQN